MGEGAPTWFHATPGGTTPARRRGLDRLRQGMEDAGARPGLPAHPGPGDEHLRRLIAERTVRLTSVALQREQAFEELRRLEADLRALDREIAGYRADLRARGGGAPEQAAGGEATHWSPVPILGYRFWKWRNGRLHGGRVAWPGPFLEARCLTTGVMGDASGVPHTHGECGHQPCGIYAVKGFGDLPTGPSMMGRAVGLVALTGKVVEHAAGYRAQFARVVALSIAWDGRRYSGEDPAWIEAVFAGENPALGTARFRPARPDPPGGRFGFFERAERTCLETWTSVRSSE